MRWIVLASLALTAGCTGQTGVQSGGKPQGCIGRAIGDCLQSLNAGLNLDVAVLNREAERFRAVDVNGRPLGGNGIILTGHLREPRGAGSDAFTRHKYNALILISVDFDPQSKIVTKIHSSIPRNPTFLVRTEAEYDSTGLFEIMEMAIACPSATKIDFYRFVENTVKPQTMGAAGKTVHSGRASTTERHVRGLEFCGRKIGFDVVTGREIDSVSLSNPTGAVSAAFISFEGK